MDYNYTDNNSQSYEPEDDEADMEEEHNLNNYYVPLGFLAIIIVLVNSFIIILVCRKPKLRTSCNALFVSLAAVDGTTGLIGIPLLMVTVLNSDNIPLHKICYFALSVHTWFWFLAVCSMLHLLVIAHEQFLAILKPFNHDKIFTKSSVTVILTVIWIVSVSLAFVPWTWILPLGDQFCMIDDEQVQRYDEMFTLVTTVICFFLPVGIIMYLHLRIVVEARRHIVRIKHEHRASKSQYRVVSPYGRFRGFYVIAIMWLVFVFCWAPYFIAVLLVTYQDKELSFWLDYKLTVLRFLPSVLNPVMFAFWKSDFRKICFALLGRWVNKPPDQLRSLTAPNDSKPQKV